MLFILIVYFSTDELASLQVSLKESETRCQKFSALESKLNETNEKMKNQTLLHQSATSTYGLFTNFLLTIS